MRHDVIGSTGYRDFAIRDQGDTGCCQAFSFSAMHELVLRKGPMCVCDLVQEYMLEEGALTLEIVLKLSRVGQRTAEQAGCETCARPGVPYVRPGSAPDAKERPGPAKRGRSAHRRIVCEQLPLNTKSVRAALLENRPVCVCLDGACAPDALDGSAKAHPERAVADLRLDLPGLAVATEGHAVCLVGFEDRPEDAEGGAFRFANSYGSAWGGSSARGFGTITFAFFKKHALSAWAPKK